MSMRCSMVSAIAMIASSRLPVVTASRPHRKLKADGWATCVPLRWPVGHLQGDGFLGPGRRGRPAGSMAVFQQHFKVGHPWCPVLQPKVCAMHGHALALPRCFKKLVDRISVPPEGHH